MDNPYPEKLHYSEIPDSPPDRVLAREVATYKREVARLIAEGNEGRFVLIKGDDTIGLWDSFWEAVDAGRKQFGMVPFAVHQVLTWEPVLRQRYV
jgi:hypothetical protein